MIREPSLNGRGEAAVSDRHSGAARLRLQWLRRHLDTLANHCKTAIRGVASSGKTMMALAKAQPLGQHGPPSGDEPEIVQGRSIADAFTEAGRQISTRYMPDPGRLKMSQDPVRAPRTHRDKMARPIWHHTRYHVLRKLGHPQRRSYGFLGVF